MKRSFIPEFVFIILAIALTGSMIYKTTLLATFGWFSKDFSSFFGLADLLVFFIILVILPLLLVGIVKTKFSKQAKVNYLLFLFIITFIASGLAAKFEAFLIKKDLTPNITIYLDSGEELKIKTIARVDNDIVGIECVRYNYCVNIIYSSQRKTNFILTNNYPL